MRRITTMAAVAAVGIATIGAPATASASSHWSKSQCVAYKTSFLRKHKHPTSKQASEANKTLKTWGCSQRV
jgi:hypothetical protein